MSDKMIIRFCSPTLAGLKVASLFTCKFTNKSRLCRDICKANVRLSGKGIKLQILNIFGNMAVIYIYRINVLASILNDEKNQDFLSDYGYSSFDIKSVLKKLSYRMKKDKNFPHEIGVFLGYPLEDTINFIKNNGKNYLCSGYWKVYKNKKDAIKIFNKYKKCTEIYCRKYEQGTCIEKLTIA